MNSPTQELASYIVNEEYSNLPSEVIEKAKRCILDSIGCQLGGYNSEPGRRMAKIMVEFGGRHDATVSGDGTKAPLHSASLVNTYLANVLDYDDTFRGHPGCTVIPPALAGAEMIGASGKELIVAVVVGYEVHSRVCGAMYTKPENLDKIGGVAPQTLGSAASCSKILSLSYESVCDALGIAGATAPVQSNIKTGGPEAVPPTMKIGFYSCSLTGTISTLMAKFGITGPHDILDGETGFWRMIGADECHFDYLTQGLGFTYEIMDVAYKPYSCCRWLHSSIDAVMAVFQQNQISLREIQNVKITTMAGETNIEYMKNPQPENFIAAQFSLPYSIAVAMYGVTPGPDWIAPSTRQNRDILALASKIQCKFELKNWRTGSNANNWPATVVIRLDKGDEFSHTVEFPKGSPKNMMTDKELDTKFFSMATPVIGEERASQIAEMTRNLEKVDDLREIGILLKEK
jgi:2-methylcitrate dehydratase PrpD